MQPLLKIPRRTVRRIDRRKLSHAALFGNRCWRANFDNCLSCSRDSRFGDNGGPLTERNLADAHLISVVLIG
jgi:hypothetical protein